MDNTRIDTKYGIKKFLYLIFFLAISLKSFSQKKSIHINGIGNNSNITEVKIYKPTWFWWRDYKNSLIATSIKGSDNRFKLKLNLDHPQLLYLEILGHSLRVLATPGDSLNFELLRNDNRRLQFFFSGENAAHYNFFQLLENLNYKRPVFNGNINKHKNSLDSIYKIKIELMRTFVAENKVSEDFIFLAEAEIKYEHCFNLYSVVQRGKIKIKELPNGYLDEVAAFDFNNDRLLESARFKEALISKYIHCFTENPWESFNKTLININQNFKGKIKDYLITSMIGIYARKQNENYKEALLRTIENAQSNMKDSLFLQHISQSQKDYLMLNKPFPEEVMSNSLLVDVNENSLSLNELLNRYKGKIVYIDFWASWCSACRIDIAGSSEAKKYLQDQDVVYLYISMDKNRDISKWKQASKKDGIVDNQFLLKNDFMSPLAQFLRINFLPRYVIIDDKHILKVAEAPRPTDSQLVQLKTSISNVKQHVVTFK